MLCTVREVNRFLPPNRADKILLMPGGIIRADLPLPHDQCVVFKIAKPPAPTVSKSDSPDAGDLEAVARRANRLSLGRGASEDAALAGRGIEP